jgi:hypothetical protein
MRRRTLWIMLVLLVALLAAGGLYLVLRTGRAAHAPRTPALPTGQPSVSPLVPTPPADAAADPYALLSQEAMLETIDALASIQPYSGWRNSATTGEAEALDYIDQALDGFGYLADLGLEQERQSFEVPLATELWDTGLGLTLDGQPVQVPASGLRGSRTDAALARSFDSDGALGDSERNPVIVEGPVSRIRSAGELDGIPPKGLESRVVLLDYSVIDPVVRGGMDQAVETAEELLAKSPAGLVLVTQFSNEEGESHGSFASDGGALNRVEAGTLPPVVHVRLEDMAAAGIESWDGLERVESATLRWDADVLSPARSGNLVARIPGSDPSKAVVLGAHIDSVNTPGAMDDASGSAVLLEIARVLDAVEVQPPTDLYLAWFGSEELGLLGSAHFVNTHPEVLGRTAAMLQIDCLTYPLEGIDAQLALVTWSGSPLGEERVTWPAYLAQVARLHGVTVGMEDVSEIFSDNHCFGQATIPNADLVFMDIEAMQATGSLHYAAHIHDPYDTAQLAREEADALEQMARVALAAALESLP